jgi:excisionase family DNA binding protein
METAPMIDHTYDHFRRKTETDMAAAILTLAAVLHGEQDRWLTPKEAAALKKCSVDSIYQQCEAGTLKHTRIGKGGHIRILESALRTSA